MADETEESRGDVVPNWFLGGERRRLLLEAVTTRPKRGWTVLELKERTGCGQATAYEVVRVLRGLGLLEPTGSKYRYRVASDHKLAAPLNDLLKELRRYASRTVDRPSRGGRGT
jgi:DNA-binding IclR family transcriptional regulator